MARTTHAFCAGLALSAAFALATPSATGQVLQHGPRRRRNTVTVNPADLLQGVVAAEFEHAFGNSVSLAATPEFLLGRGVRATPEVSALGAGLEVAARFFIEGEAPGGGWIGPTAGILYVTLKTATQSASAVGFTAGGMLGYTFIFRPGFVLSLGAGGQYLYAVGRVDDGPSLRLSEARLAVRVGLGWSF